MYKNKILINHQELIVFSFVQDLYKIIIKMRENYR